MTSDPRLFPALALAVAMGLPQAAPAFQEPLTCMALAGALPIVRHNGQAELVSDIVLNCTGGTPVAAGAALPLHTVRVELGVPASSRVLDAASGASEALLAVDEHLLAPGAALQACPATGVPCPVTGTGGAGSPYHEPGAYNLFQGRAAVAGNVIEFVNVPIDPPGVNGMRLFRVTNIRADVSGAPLPNPAPVAIVATVSITGAAAIPVNNSQLAVAFPIESLKVEIRDAESAAVIETPQSLLACDLSATPAPQFHIRVTEQMNAAALRTRTQTPWPNADAGAPVTPQDVLGSFYPATESGYYNPALPAAGGLDRAGLADSGTRFYVLIDNLPAGVTAWASAYAAGKTAANSPVRALQPSPLTADGGTLALAPVTQTAAGPLVQLVPFGGRHLAVFEYTGLSDLPFPPSFGFDPPFDIALYLSAGDSVSAGSMTVSAGVGPVPLAPMSEPPAPRFMRLAGPSVSASIAPCATCMPRLGVTIQEKSGPPEARKWTLRVSNEGRCDATDLRLIGAEIMKVGQGGAPSIESALPISLTSLAAGESGAADVVFQIPASVSTVKVKLHFDANGRLLPPQNLNNERP
jgi:hypothetical protein